MEDSRFLQKSVKYGILHTRKSVLTFIIFCVCTYYVLLTKCKYIYQIFFVTLQYLKEQNITNL